MGYRSRLSEGSASRSLSSLQVVASIPVILSSPVSSSEPLVRSRTTRIASRIRRPTRVNFMYLFDLDNDRRVTREEYALLRGPASTFKAYDLKEDGVVTDDEIRYPERYADGKGGGREAAGRAAENRTVFDLHDKDGNGRVTPEEFGGAEAVFRRLDRDRDGVITAADA